MSSLRYVFTKDISNKVYSITSEDSLKEAFYTRERWTETNNAAAVVVGNKNGLEIYRQDLQITQFGFCYILIL